MIWNDAGFIANECWLNIPKHFPNVILHEHIIMPNHVHGIIELVGANNYSPEMNSNEMNLRNHPSREMDIKHHNGANNFAPEMDINHQNGANNYSPEIKIDPQSLVCALASALPSEEQK
jgi:hypothetical protein